jgi:H+/Cl- antiporter ClcA
MALAFLSTAACGFISSEAEGSGIPEFKTIMSGIKLHKPLQARTLLAKVLGIMLIYIAGFYVGMECPIIHCSAIIAENITSFKYFSKFKRNHF